MLGSYLIPRSMCSWIPKPKLPEAEIKMSKLLILTNLGNSYEVWMTLDLLFV